MLSQKIEFGSVGIPNLAEMNLCLLASCVKRYQLDTVKLWKQIIDHKYRNYSPNLFTFPELGASPSRRVCFGLLGLQKWGIDERWGVEGILSFGRTIGLARVA
jgi:hypothetical protein